MKKSIFSLGVMFAAAFTLANAQAVLAQSSYGSTITDSEPAVALVMPFDQTAGHQSYMLVSRTGGEVSILATHWSFWSDSCDHLGDVFICLTDNDTIVVDPSAVQSQTQPGVENINSGPVLDFSGDKGFVTVSAFEADPNIAACIPANRNDPELFDQPSLVGGWTIADTASKAAFGNNAIGIIDGVTLPDTSEFFTLTSGLNLQFFNPETLEDSEVIVIGIGSPNGNGEFADVEIGPIPATRPNDDFAMCCNAEYYDNIETNISIPDVCFQCAEFTHLTEGIAKKAGNDPTHFLIPDSKAPNTSGFLTLTNCEVGDGEGGLINLSDGSAPDGLDGIFPFAFHGMAVGPYGTAANGKYTSTGG